jgi:hypothetical protein
MEPSTILICLVCLALLVYLPKLRRVVLWIALPPVMALIEFPKVRKPAAIIGLLGVLALIVFWLSERPNPVSDRSRSYEGLPQADPHGPPPGTSLPKSDWAVVPDPLPSGFVPDDPHLFGQADRASQDSVVANFLNEYGPRNRKCGSVDAILLEPTLHVAPGLTLEQLQKMGATNGPTGPTGRGLTLSPKANHPYYSLADYGVAMNAFIANHPKNPNLAKVLATMKRCHLDLTDLARAQAARGLAP